MLDLEEPYDRIEIYKGNEEFDVNILHVLSGSEISEEEEMITIDSKNVLIVFKSDINNGKKGFVIRYETDTLQEEVMVGDDNENNNNNSRNDSSNNNSNDNIDDDDSFIPSPSPSSSPPSSPSSSPWLPPSLPPSIPYNIEDNTVVENQIEIKEEQIDEDDNENINKEAKITIEEIEEIEEIVIKSIGCVEI